MNCVMTKKEFLADLADIMRYLPDDTTFEMEAHRAEHELPPDGSGIDRYEVSKGITMTIKINGGAL